MAFSVKVILVRYLQVILHYAWDFHLSKQEKEGKMEESR